jgi:hypothetical protein
MFFISGCQFAAIVIAPGAVSGTTLLTKSLTV